MITRRELLQTGMVAGSAALFSLGARPSLQAAEGETSNGIYSRILGWMIGPQIYSFNHFPFDEAVKLV